MKLKIIIGSTRPGRVGLPITNWFYGIAEKNGKFEVEVLDLAVINLPLMDEPNHPRLHQYTKQHTKNWSKKIVDGDAYIFVTPEYNYSLPATIKNAIDYLSQEWQYKPVGFVSYGGIAAGTRSVQMLKQVVTTLNMMPIYESINIPFVSEYISDEGNFVSNERFDTNAQEMLNKIYLWAKHLKALREEINSSKEL
jgi:NAD(P)H-dependent FMN reductase